MKAIRLLIRWIRMLFGKSIFHVKQRAGNNYSKTGIKGYYNDLTNKVSCQTVLDDKGIPINKTITGISANYPIAVFQYGLGLYDLYLEKKDITYLEKFYNICDWALKNQSKNGMWNCMSKLGDKVNETQSSMCQGEGISLLLRAYISTKNKKYYDSATKAVEFMETDIKYGGTLLIEDNKYIFQEYVSKYNVCVLNGWIFSIFGLYDYTLVSEDKKHLDLLNKTIISLTKQLKKYDRGFWTNYDLKGTIASPAYHYLHIEQLKVLYDLFGIEEFNFYANKWKNYQNIKLFKIIAMIIKLKQKIITKKFYDINTSIEK